MSRSHGLGRFARYAKLSKFDGFARLRGIENRPSGLARQGFVELHRFERFDTFESKMDGPDKIKSRSPAHEVRRLAGYEDDADWRRFLVRLLYHRCCFQLIVQILTHERARSFASKNTALAAWSAVQPVQYDPMFEELNKELNDRGLRTITKDMFHWRMNQAVTPLLKQQKDANTSLPEVTSKPSNEERRHIHGPQVQAEPAASSSSRPENALPSINELLQSPSGSRDQDQTTHKYRDHSQTRFA
jgi:hypothetical protein